MNSDFSGNEAVHIPWSREHRLWSDIVKDDYRIWVSLPKDYDPEHPGYPVIYLMDGNILHCLVTDTIRLLRHYEEIPACILVSVGYPDEEDHPILRNRDYGPTPFNIDHAGQADQFTDFLMNELMPYIDKHYQTNPKDRSLVGDSTSGLFVIYALLSQPQLFGRYVAGSPSLYWDDGYIFKVEEAYYEKHKDLNSKVFMSIGALEQKYEPPVGKMYDNVLKMNDILLSRDYTGLELTTHIFEDETHVSVIPATMSRGLKTVFGNIHKDRSEE